MSGIFKSEHLRSLLHNKFVVLIGDSVQRSIYKDLVVLYNGNRFISQSELRKKGEDSFLNDRLVERSELTNGSNYKEVREYKTEYFLLRFYFITRVYNEYVESILHELCDPEQPTPDVIVFNSCLWDISRYGPSSMDTYGKNMDKLCKRLDEVIPVQTLVVWRTTLPVSEEMRGGFLTADTEWCRDMLKLNVLQANYTAHNVVTRHKYDVLDMHFHFRYQLHRQARDGVHWNMHAHRRITNILLTHIANAWSIQVPNFPWENDLSVNLSLRDIEMNTTNVLIRAYQPETLRRKERNPFFEVCGPSSRRLSLEEERYGGPIRTTHEMYHGFYDVPQEKFPRKEDRGDYNCNYHVISPFFNVHEPPLPTSPYPENSYPYDQRRRIIYDTPPGPIRRQRRNRNKYSQHARQRWRQDRKCYRENQYQENNWVKHRNHYRGQY